MELRWLKMVWWLERDRENERERRRNGGREGMKESTLLPIFSYIKLKLFLQEED